MFLFAALTAMTTATSAQTFMKGGQFMDYILPINGSVPATAGDWGTTAGAYNNGKEDAVWTGTLGRWKDNGIEDNTNSYWGGNVQKGDDGKYHIFVAGWPEASPKGHETWRTGSKCYHGISDYPDRGFVWHEELGDGHNTESYRLTDGRTVVYNIELRYISNETTLNSSTTWTLGKFNWDKRDRRLSRGVDPKVSLSNCTFARRRDGSFLMMDRGGCVWVSRDGVDEYHQQTDHTAYAGNRTRYFEDPVIWHDHMQYYMVVNDYDARVAYLSRSLDGLHWLNEPGVAYQTGVVKHQNGDLEDWYKLERPKIQTDEHGRATYINWAVIDAIKDVDTGAGDGHSSKNVIAPLVKSRFLEVLGSDVITESTTSIRVKIKKEDDFDPANINLSSLRFGSYDVVNYGNGFTATASETDGDGNLIVTFTGEAGVSGITADEFAPKMIGEDNDGNIVYGYAKLSYVNYWPAMVSAVIPGINEENYISTVHIDNFGLSASEAQQVKILDASGTVLSTGDLRSLDAYESYDLPLKGVKKPSAGIEQIVIAFYKDGEEIDRNTIYTDSILAQQQKLDRLVTKAKGFLDDEKYTTGKDDLTTIYNEGQQKLAWFDFDQLKDLNSRMEQAMKTFLYANGVTTQSWDFYSAALQNATITMTDNYATTLDGHSMKIADYMTVGETKQKFYGRIAMDQGSGYLNIRNSGEGMNNTGLFNYSNDSYLSVLNLVPGDEVTFSLADMKQLPTIYSENVYVKGDETKTILARGTQITSDVTYVVKEGSQMDILTYHYTCITGLNVESSSPETVEAPAISIGSDLTVTITAAEEGSAGSAVTATYYTTDGTTPSSINGTAYTAPFTVSMGTLIRAISYVGSVTASKVQSLRATVPSQTWNFTDKTAWPNDKSTVGKQYDTTGNEVATGGVIFNFATDEASFANRGLNFNKNGVTTQAEGNNLQVTVPAGMRLVVNNNAWSAARAFRYTIDGTTNSEGTVLYNQNNFTYTNTTADAQVFTIWATGTEKSGSGAQLYISSIVLEDPNIDSYKHQCTVTAKCGDITVDSWTVSDIMEYSAFNYQAKAYLYNDNQLYVLNDDKIAGAASGNYLGSAEVEGSDIELTLNYDLYTAGDIVYFAEAESLGNSSTNSSTTASGGMTAHANSGKLATLCTLPAGNYSIFVGTTQDRDVYLRNAGVSENTQNSIVYWNKNQSDVKTFTLTASTQLALSGYTTSGGGLNQAGDVDFVLIRATGADVPASALGFQTFAADCALDFSETTSKAYIATGATDGKVQMQQVTKVPAGTGLLLQGMAEETIPVLTTGDADDVTSNLLVRGTGSPVTKEDGYCKYVLGEDNGSVSFFLINNTAATVATDKAYLRVPNVQAGARLVIIYDGEVTVINGIKQSDNSQTANCYNLNGQRVSQPAKGLYIINGKKVIVK